MKRHLNTSLAITAAAAALAWVGGASPPTKAAQAEDSAERSFTLSSDAEEVVLQYNYGGGMGPAVVYTLYGDGRLVHERVNQAANEVRDHVETHLDFLQRHELVRIVVDSGFLECDPDCIESRCARLRGIQRIPPTADCGGLILTLNLESYQGPGEPAPHPVRRREYLDCPRGLVSYYCSAAELPEAQALLDLATALREHKAAAQEVQP